MRLFVAILLSLLIPGTGQFVNGQRWKGILFIGLDLLFIVLKYTVSLIPIYLLYLVVLVDVIVIGIQMIQGKREAPTGKPYVIEVVAAFLIAGVLTWGVDAGMEKWTHVSFKDLTSGQTLSEEKEKEVKKEAEAYLKEKYGKEFDVDQIKYAWQANRYTMRGHLKGEEDSNFSVSMEDGEYTDAYFVHKYSKAGREEIKPHLESAFTSRMNWYSSVTVAKKEEKRLAKQDLTYPELREETDRYQQQIKVNVPIKLTGSNQAQELGKAYQLIAYLNQNGIHASLQVSYYDPSLQKEKGIREVDFTKQARYGEYVTGYLEVEDVSQVTSEEDLKKYVEIY